MIDLRIKWGFFKTVVWFWIRNISNIIMQKKINKKCDLFHGENHFEIHILDPELCLFEYTCFVHGNIPLLLTTCLVKL